MAKARILAVDDQLYFRTFIDGLLTEEGYSVHTASGGDEALRALERETFEIVLTDLVMPGMSGHELVRQIKARDPDQEVVVLTGVGDVRSAVEAMKLGATDYLLKPIERTSLTQTFEGILQSRRMRAEHARLMAENLEYMGVLSLYERAVRLFAMRALEPMAERIAEGLCLATHAQGGVVWLAGESDETTLRLSGARGLVQLDREPEVLPLDSLPAPLESLADAETASRIVGPPDEEEALFVPLRHAGRCVGIARLTDKLEGAPFHDRDRAAAEKFAEIAAVAVDGALRFRSLERRSLKDPTTRAYTLAFFDDIVRNEIQKAQRFARSFSILKLELSSLEPLRHRMSETELGRWLESLVFEVGGAVRTTDIVATESDRLYRVLLSETGALGAAALKRRVRESLETSPVLADLGPAERPRLLISAASFPADGTQADMLEATLERRLDEERASPIQELKRDAPSFAALVDALLDRAHPDRTERLEQVGCFLLDEVGRRPKDRALLFIAPGAGVSMRLRDRLEALRGSDARTEVVLVTDEPIEPGGVTPITRVSPGRTGTQAPFLVYYGEGPAYALVRERGETPSGASLFHTSDRALVEQLAFQLQSELGISVAAG
ncbi:MAG: response regulator [Deltaproteobacteria bacterium]|nr:MAG: response regulator [Deltaproteobacteria bacterium]